MPSSVSPLQQLCVGEESVYSLLPTLAEPVKGKVSDSDHCQNSLLMRNSAKSIKLLDYMFYIHICVCVFMYMCTHTNIYSDMFQSLLLLLKYCDKVQAFGKVPFEKD